MNSKYIVARNSTAGLIEMDLTMEQLTRLEYLAPDALRVRTKENGSYKTQFELKNGPTSIGTRTVMFPFSKENKKAKILFVLGGNEPKYSFANAVRYLQTIETVAKDKLKNIEKTENETEVL